MSYYRPPDGVPGADPMPEGPAPIDPSALAASDEGWPAAPSSLGLPSDPAPISIQQVADAAAASEARRKRKQAIIIGCVVVDVIILAIVLAVFVL